MYCMQCFLKSKYITVELSMIKIGELLRKLWSRGGVLPMWWVIHMCRGFDPLFSLWQDRARSFGGIFSHPPTPKRSFGVLKLPILTEFDLLGPKFHFSLDLFGSNFQRPAAHPHHFSDRVPPPGLWSLRSCFLILPPGALAPQGIKGAVKRNVSKHWCTLQWCASRGWVIAHENWTSCFWIDSEK